MRRTAVLMALAALLLAGCGHGGADRADPIARGWMERSALLSPEYPAYRAVYDTVQVRAPFVEMLKNVVGGVETVVFLGTWCSDSRQHVPRFLKVADAAGIPAGRIRLYALDRSKKSDDGETDRYAIEKVPTFIFLKGGKEVGRIVEIPQESIEGDMLMILAKAAAEQ